MAGIAREPVMDAVKTLLKSIRKDNGYQNDVAFVTRWPFEYEELRRIARFPTIVMTAGDERMTSQTLGRTNAPIGHLGATYHWTMAIGLLIFTEGIAQDVLDANLEQNPNDTLRATLIEDILKVLHNDKGLGLYSYGVMMDVDTITVSDFLEVPREELVFGISMQIMHSYRQGEL